MTVLNGRKKQPNNLIQQANKKWKKLNILKKVTDITWDTFCQDFLFSKNILKCIWNETDRQTQKF